MATGNNNHYISKENQQTDNEDPETNDYPQDSFSAHRNEDNSGRTSTNDEASSSPDETQKEILSMSICIDTLKNCIDTLKMENELENDSSSNTDNDSYICPLLLVANKDFDVKPKMPIDAINVSQSQEINFACIPNNANMNWNDLDNKFKSDHDSIKKILNTQLSIPQRSISSNIFMMSNSQVSGSKDEHVTKEKQKLPEVPGKRDIIILQQHNDRNRAHVFRERIKGIWRSEAQSNDITVDLEMVVAIGLSEMTLDTKLFDVYRIIIVYLTQSFDVDEHRRFRMESILKECHKRHGNVSRRVIPVWIDVDPGQSQHIQLNILQGLSADSDTEIKHLFWLLASDSE